MTLALKEPVGQGLAEMLVKEDEQISDLYAPFR
jgi:hypothetical protein